jgi:hypothetical protein
MKKIILSLLLVISTSLLFSQTYYKAKITELYTYNTTTKEWNLYDKNSDVNITVVVEDEFISFQAKTPSFYKIYTETKEPFNTKSYRGYRYSGKDLKTDTMVKVDILGSNEEGVAMVSIVNSVEGYNFRFFLIKE